jgi:hypothetical protein
MKKQRMSRSTKPTKKYFTQDHEDAILRYVATDDKRIRTDLYVKWIGPAFDEMVDKIVFTYKFTTLPNIDYLRDECKIWLITILDKYDVSQGSKAFSYFSVITKNWFIHKVKRKSKKNQTELDIQEMPKDLELRYLSEDNPYEETREHDELIDNLRANMIDWMEESDKPNDEKVIKAIQVLFESAHEIEIFNKKAIYLYLREITGLNTKQVVSSLKRLKSSYQDFRKDWDQDL